MLNSWSRFLNYPIRITYIGRLDKDSEGLLLMTNNGDIINKMMRARNRHEKEYKVTVGGAPCTASQLDKMVSNEVTNMQYLMLANIQNGIIDNKLPYLSSIEPKYEKYCLKNNDLILSKNGYPYKVAVASVKDGQRILANGNLYIIELDESRANPYYIINDSTSVV